MNTALKVCLLKMLLRLKKTLCVVLSVFVAQACTFNYGKAILTESLQKTQLADRHSVTRRSNWTLAETTPLALLGAKPLMKNDQGLYARSLQRFNAQLSRQFLLNFPATSSLPATLTLHEALLVARHQGASLLVVPRFIEADNRLNSLSEMDEGAALHPGKTRGRDTLHVQILIYDAVTGALIDSASIVSEARYLKSDDKLPLDMLEMALQSYFEKILRPSYS